ncbi:hypothetical protein HN011_006261 [Eciton burchellii]|nr:hypothetical protein HN011_006261 [Eciton burchellii]
MLSLEVAQRIRLRRDEEADEEFIDARVHSGYGRICERIRRYGDGKERIYRGGMEKARWKQGRTKSRRGRDLAR